MFATIANGYPGPPETTDDDDAVRAILAVQVEAGLELLSDGQALAAAAGSGSGVVERWRKAARSIEAGERPVKQTVAGPYSSGWLRGKRSSARSRRAVSLAMAEAVNADVRSLVEAGCPFVQVEERTADRIGEDEAERRLWLDCHRRVTAGVRGGHVSLAILEGSGDVAGVETIFDAPYASYLFDLIRAPDNWRLAMRAPLERGVILGALDHRPGVREVKETLVWAASYAASSGRGLDRIGLSTAGSLGDCSWQEARARIELLAQAASIAAIGDLDERMARLDPRATDFRSAAVGRYTRPSRPGRGKKGG